MKRLISLCCAFFILTTSCVVFAEGEKLDIDAKSSLLMEQSTKKVLYEDNADEKLPIASVTKIMTLLLIMEAIDEGKITMDDTVVVSERAMSMGGSTMFLESGDELSVYEIVKGIAVASANDGCVAMAEHICGSEEAFVGKMNERAKELGMTNTNFANTNGLDEDNHYSTARDVAIMSQELLKHEKIFEFTTIWTDKMNNGKFDLSNTNRLIRFYPGANGLKTGSTGKALCCISASAKRDGMQLIAVVLASPTSDERFASAKTLLDYGFANYGARKLCEKNENIETLVVKKGICENVNILCRDDFSILTAKGDKTEIQKEIFLPKNLRAPVKAGEVVGEVKFSKDGKEIGKMDLIVEKEVLKKDFGDYLRDLFSILFS